MATDERVRILLEAQNKASGAIKQVQGDLKGVGSQATSAAGGLRGIGSAASVMAAAFAAVKVGQLVVDLSQLGQQTAVLGASFETLAGQAGVSSDRMMQSLRAASGGMISDYNLMLAANRAMMLGVADSTEEMEALLAVATNRGRAMGLSVEQAFSDLVTGLGRASPMILDNLGIVVDSEKLYSDYAKSLGTTADKLTEVEKKQALVNSVMQEAEGLAKGTGDAAVVAADNFARFAAEMDNLKRSLGEVLNKAAQPIVGVGAGIMETVSDVLEGTSGRTLKEVEQLIADSERILADYRRDPRGEAYMGQFIGMELDNLRMLREEYAALGGARDTALSDYGIAQAEAAQVTIDVMGALQANNAAIAQHVADFVESMQRNLLPTMGTDVFAQSEQWAATLSQTYMQATQAGLSHAQAMMMVENQARTMTAALYEQAVAQQQSTTSTNNMLAGMMALASIQDTVTQATQNTGLAAYQVTAILEGAVAAYQNMVAAGYSTEAALSAANAMIWASVAGLEAADVAAQGATGSLASFGITAASAAPQVGALGAAADVAALQFAGLGAAAQQASKDIAAALGTAVAGEKMLNDAVSIIEGAAQKGRAANFEFPTTFKAIDDFGSKVSALNQKVLYMPPAMAAGGRAVRGLGSSATAANSELSKLESTVASLLQGALDPGVGVNPDDLLPRQDAINENARRLADIAVNGFKGQSWLEEFKSEVPDIYNALVAAGDPKAAAAQFLRDFQDGLVPELIDKEAAKDRVRRMILGQQTMAQLAQEIAGELAAEMGISLGQAQQMVAGALGTGPLAQAGAGTMDGSQTGGLFVDTLTKAIADKQSAIQSSGQLTGATWGTAFLGAVEGNVPAALVALLALALTPAVMANIAAENSRRGAR